MCISVRNNFGYFIQNIILSKVYIFVNSKSGSCGIQHVASKCISDKLAINNLITKIFFLQHLQGNLFFNLIRHLCTGALHTDNIIPNIKLRLLTLICRGSGIDKWGEYLKTLSEILTKRAQRWFLQELPLVALLIFRSGLGEPHRETGPPGHQISSYAPADFSCTIHRVVLREGEVV